MAQWCFHSAGAPIPYDAVRGGHDGDGSPIYVGRASHNGVMLPAKVVPSKGGAYICSAGQEYLKTSYEILCGHGYSWVSASNGFVPPNAVSAGCSESGEPLYVGRSQHANSLCVGKVHRSHGCLYIPYGGYEIKLPNYEVLVSVSQHCHGSQAPMPDNWVQSRDCCVIPGAVIAGHRNADQAPIYVARATHNHRMIPGKFIPSHGGCFICSGGSEHHKKVFDVLVGEGYHWVNATGVIPPNAVPTNAASTEEPLFIGRGYFEGTLTPGVISRKDHCLKIAYFGKTQRVHSYEVLCRY